MSYLISEEEEQKKRGEEQQRIEYLQSCIRNDSRVISECEDDLMRYSLQSHEKESYYSRISSCRDSTKNYQHEIADIKRKQSERDYNRQLLQSAFIKAQEAEQLEYAKGIGRARALNEMMRMLCDTMLHYKMQGLQMDDEILRMYRRVQEYAKQENMEMLDEIEKLFSKPK